MIPSPSLPTSENFTVRKASHVLTGDQIAEIKRLRCNGARIVDLSKAFGVTPASIRHHVRSCIVSVPLRKIEGTPRSRKPNKYDTDGVTCRIELEPGVYALIDHGIATVAKKYIWICNRRRDGMPSAVISTTRTHIRLHDLVYGPHDGFCLDHKNRNPLDNRRDNLRVASCSQNNMNRRKAQSKSGYRGVIYRPHIGRWAAYIKMHGVMHWLGTHETPEMAARVRDEAAKQMHGDFAVLNFTEQHHASAS